MSLLVFTAVAAAAVGYVLTPGVLASSEEVEAARLHRAILAFIAEHNPKAPMKAFRDYPGVLLAEAAETGIDHCIPLAQAYVESEFRPDAVGDAGEIGLYQMLPSTATFFEKALGAIRRPVFARGKRDLGDLADPIVSTKFAMAYLRDIMTRKPTLRDALTEYNGGPNGRKLDYYRQVMTTYVELLERSELGCRYQPTPRPLPVMALVGGA
jgi:soluble lytic murein transglycosylase-like protein